MVLAGTLTLNFSKVIENESDNAPGGGILNTSGSILNLNQTTVENNVPDNVVNL